MDDHEAVGGEMDIHLEAVGTGPQPEIERRQRVFRSERAASAVREYERAIRMEETHKSKARACTLCLVT